MGDRDLSSGGPWCSPRTAPSACTSAPGSVGQSVPPDVAFESCYVQPARGRGEGPPDGFQTVVHRRLRAGFEYGRVARGCKTAAKAEAVQICPDPPPLPLSGGAEREGFPDWAC